ncbi:MAG: ATP-binding cassette domain-containing protein [Acidiferrobacteraceae bacterium]
MPTTAALVLDGVRKYFPEVGGAGVVWALKDLSVSVRPGTITGLLGPDGAGKTTLMRLAAGLLTPTAGTVTVFGADTQQEASAVSGLIGYMPQRFGLYEDLTVRENLELYADLQGLAPSDRQGRYDHLLRMTALGPFGARRAGALSGGMKQKLGLACTLLRTPRLLLLDEPTVGVDPISRRELWAIIQDLVRTGVTVFISTAYLDEAERCHDLIVLREGQLFAKGSPDEFRAPLAGRTFLVQASDGRPRRLRQLLVSRPGLIDAQIRSDEVRVIMAIGVGASSASGETWVPVAPRFEDAFVALLGAQHPPQRTADLPAAEGHPRAEVSLEPMIRVRDLRRSFGHFEAVKGISFEVAPGEIFGLLGANGAGKTTAFRMLCGLLPPSSGELLVAGSDARNAGAQARRHIGYVSQKFSLYGNLSVMQNLRFFADAYGLRGMHRTARLRWAEEEFDLGPYRMLNADALPLGFKQRLALACALMHEPKILFLDEPTSGVDPLARREFWARIGALAERGVTVMITTHFMEEAEYCDHVVLLSRGEILAAGTPAEIRRRAERPQCPQPTMEDAFVALIEGHEAENRRVS